MLCNLIWPNLRTSALALSAQTSIGDHFKVKQQPTRTFIISGRGSIKISWKVGKMWRPETPPPRKTQSPSLHFNNIKKWQNAQKILWKSLCPKDSIFLWLSSILHTRSSSWFWCPWPGLEFAYSWVFRTIHHTDQWPDKMVVDKMLGTKWYGQNSRNLLYKF